LVALILCCTLAATKIAEQQEIKERARRPGRDAGPGVGGRPHAIRDEYGFYRTRGYFPGYQASPAPGARGSSLVNPASAKQKQSFAKSPGGYNI